MKVYFTLAMIFILGCSTNNSILKPRINPDTNLSNTVYTKENFSSLELHKNPNPKPGYKIREILIGAASQNFITFSIESSKPRGKSVYEDTIFIKKYELDTGRLVKKQIIGQTNYTWFEPASVLLPASYAKYRGKDDIFNFDLGEYLNDLFIEYAFPSVNYINNLCVNENGLVLTTKNHKGLVIINDDLLKKILSVSNLDNVKILSVYETYFRLFFQFQLKIKNGIEEDYTQIIVPIIKPEIQEEWKKIKYKK